MKKLDVLFINASNPSIIYQDLSKKYSAIETPIWAGMLASHVISRGFNTEILDCEALGYSKDYALYHIGNLKPTVACFVVYGQQPSASTQNMEGATALAKDLKLKYPEIKILFVGGHVSALTRETMTNHPEIDYACQNEGVYTISDLLSCIEANDDINKVSGLCHRVNDKLVFNEISSIVKAENMEKDLPGIAWDLLPNPYYRTALWHSTSNDTQRQPFAAIYTSLGCPFSCSFCCINAPFKGGNDKSFRYWQPEFTIQQLDKLAKMGIVNLKLADEMFVLNENHFLKLCNLIIERGYKFNIWAYARVDTVKPKYLEILKKAGVNWLALGIESGNKSVRKDVIKGRFDDINIREVTGQIQNSGINVMGNYIFGLPEDTLETMQETLDLALELQTEGANFYSAMAYPGSQLHLQAKMLGWKLPDSYSGYSQHSYDCQPLPTKYLSAAEVLKFRDLAWYKYHTNEKYLKKVLDKFGQIGYNETIESTKISLKRKLLGD